MKRGDVVRVAEGKPRPAVIIQSDHLTTPADVLICPFTTTLVDAPLYRITVEPDEANGLNLTSQLMVDKIGPARRDRIDGVIGRLSDAQLTRLNAAVVLILDLSR